MAELSEALLEWAAAAVGSDTKVLQIRGLREGSNPWLLRLARAGVIREAVLKIGDAAAPRGLNTEAAALALAEEHRLTAPRVIAADLEGAGSGGCALLTTVLPGSSRIPRTSSVERLRAFGASVAPLHAIPLDPGADLPLRTRPIPSADFIGERRQGGPSSALLDTADEQVRASPAPDDTTVLVHADMWQGNTMWKDGVVSGLIDWEMAGAGQHGIDLAALRLDAALTFGLPAAEPVLEGWREAVGAEPDSLAYWDAVAALNMPTDMADFLPVIHDQGRTDLTPETLNERRDAFLRGALGRL